MDEFHSPEASFTPSASSSPSEFAAVTKSLESIVHRLYPSPVVSSIERETEEKLLGLLNVMNVEECLRNRSLDMHLILSIMDIIVNIYCSPGQNFDVKYVKDDGLISSENIVGYIKLIFTGYKLVKSSEHHFFASHLGIVIKLNNVGNS